MDAKMSQVSLRNAACGDHTITVAEPSDIFDPERMEPYLREVEETALKLYTWNDICNIRTRLLDLPVITRLPTGLQTINIEHTTLRALHIPPECTQIREIYIMASNIHVMPDVTHLAALDSCTIRCANMEIIPFDARQWPASLRRLDLTANSFTSYNLNIVRCLPKGVAISLGFNQLAFERLRLPYWIHEGYQIDLGPAPTRSGNRLAAMQNGDYRFSPVTTEQLHYYAARAHLGAQHGGSSGVALYFERFGDIPTVAIAPLPPPPVYQPLRGTQTVHVTSICDAVTKSVRHIRELTDAKYTHANKTALIEDFIYHAYKTLPKSAPFYKRMLAYLQLYKVYNWQMIDYVTQNTTITDTHTATKTTYGELLARVWILVREHQQRDDFLINVKYEIAESVGYCFTGRFNRLVNSLIGFVDGVTVGISVKEQLQLEMGRLIASLGKGDITYAKCIAEFGALFDDPVVAADASITKAYKDSWFFALEDYKPEDDVADEAATIAAATTAPPPVLHNYLPVDTTII